MEARCLRLNTIKHFVSDIKDSAYTDVGFPNVGTHKITVRTQEGPKR